MKPTVSISRFVRPGSLPAIVPGLAFLLLLSSCGRETGGPGGPGGTVPVRFDVFVGYGTSNGQNILRENSWNPVICEIQNSSRGFTGLIEIGDSSPHGRQMVLDLPENTTKRVTIPLFVDSSRSGRMDFKLFEYDPEQESRGREVAEYTIEAYQAEILPQDSILMGAIGSPRELPRFPGEGLRLSQRRRFPRMVPILQARFPDEVLSLEGLSSLSLNSAQAIHLDTEQKDALVRWVALGGRLILTIDNPADITATDWLRGLTPFQPEASSTLPSASVHAALRSWIEGRSEVEIPDPSPSRSRYPSASGMAGSRGDEDPFAYHLLTDWSLPGSLDDGSPVEVVAGNPMDSRILVRSGEGIPLILTSPRGRGEVTVLTFNPGQGPLQGWQGGPWMWAKLNRATRFELDRSGEGTIHAAGGSVDDVLGSLVETDQIRKMPYEWLLLILVAYLLVIGPIDYIVLKKLNRQMLTWVTFPTYVILFSGMIYYIGYYLRSGLTEWNELHVVDVVEGEGSDLLRGRAWLGVYSPRDETYSIGSTLPAFSLRPGSEKGNEESLTTLSASGMEGRLSVPLWVNQCYVAEWLHEARSPFRARLVRRDGDSLAIEVENRGSEPIEGIGVAFGGKVQVLLAGDGAHRSSSLDPVLPGQKRTLQVRPEWSIEDWLDGDSQIGRVLETRQSELGETVRLDDRAAYSISSGFLSQWNRSNRHRGRHWHQGQPLRISGPAGTDVSALVERGDVVVMAYYPGYSVLDPINRFDAPRGSRGTLFRSVLSSSPVPR